MHKYKLTISSNGKVNMYKRTILQNSFQYFAICLKTYLFHKKLKIHVNGQIVLINQALVMHLWPQFPSCSISKACFSFCTLQGFMYLLNMLYSIN